MGHAGFDGLRRSSRGASRRKFINRINFNKFVAESLDDYINKAVDLAQNPSALRALRPQLWQRMLDSKLCDAESFAHDVENAYQQMWDQWIRSVTDPIKMIRQPNDCQINISLSAAKASSLPKSFKNCAVSQLTGH